MKVKIRSMPRPLYKSLNDLKRMACLSWSISMKHHPLIIAFYVHSIANMSPRSIPTPGVTGLALTNA